ncbi:LOW QUALITY PROTEIN: histone-lysine N-methyltransferase 2D [Solanum tuberosum]|uniref:LOW QUALITY PROTEIN: histone-lysine N-methyltransferase 2D n=1 Tax=Solanum tuberosum TaxID=4113 RepID=UPI00073A2E99|nr:PREDICTED: LOW QUALITY PROTEIN: histone-lysine N-methyltransferase 2D [Solanum tuberosum]
MALLGDDGRGYELALKLESHGVWRSWLGDSLYTNFIPLLSSPSTWDSFMRTDDAKTRVQIHLQLRVRALLFDKASVSLFLRSDKPPTSIHTASIISKLNPNYLQLHGDDVYFTLDNCSQDEAQQREGVSGTSTVLSKVQSKSNFGAGSRYSESEADAMSQRLKLDDLPETWYNQFFEKYKASKSYRLQFGDSETEKRTPEQMSFYRKVVENHKRRRVAFKVDQNIGFGMLDDGSNLQSNSILDNDNPFFPETISAMNCVPDSAVLRTSQLKENQKVEFNGVLDTLPQIMTKSPIMIERLGIRPEYLSMDQGSNQNLGKNGAERSKKCLGEMQALKLSQKVMARLLGNVGFEGSSEVPLDVLTKFMSCHIRKLGSTLKLLSDSYRKQCSAMELLKMFLHTDGHSNLAMLSALVKDNTRNVVQQTQQQVHGFQQQLQPQHASAIRQSQQVQILRMHPQMQQMINSQNLTPQQQQQLISSQNLTPQQQQQLINSQNLTPQQQQQLISSQNLTINSQNVTPQQQQQLINSQNLTPQQQQQLINSQNLTPQQQQHLERLRRRQQLTPRPGMSMNMNIDKDRPLVEVKLEHPTDFPMDNNAFNAMTARQPQMQQFRQQQIAAMSSTYAQNTNQFRPMSSLQIPQVQSPNMGMARAPPVKVEGFQELMGGDSTMKHDSEENKLMSPQK